MRFSSKILWLFVLLTAVFTLTASAPLKEGQKLLKRKFAGASGFTCDACKVVVNLLQELFAQNASEDEVAKIVISVCIDLKIEDKNVCTLIVPTFRVS